MRAFSGRKLGLAMRGLLTAYLLILTTACGSLLNEAERIRQKAEAGKSGGETITAGCAQGAPALTAVIPHYSNAPNWNDYVKNDGANRYAGTNTVCAGTELGGYNACLHGGELRRLTVTNRTSCAGLTFADSLGALAWRCDASSGTAILVSTGLARGKYLSDLIDFTAGAWRPVSVSVSDSCGTAATAAGAWYTNPIVKDPTGTSPVTLAAAGTIYIFTTDPVRRYTMTANKIGFVVRPGIKLTGNGANQSVLISLNRRFSWFEGIVDATGNNDTLVLDNSSFFVLRGFHGQNITGGSPDGIYADGISNALFYDVSIHNGNSKGFTIFNASYITMVGVRCSNTPNHCLQLDANNSVAIGVIGGAANQNAIAIGVGAAYSGNAVLNATFANVQNPGSGIWTTSGSTNMSYMNIAAVNSENALSIDTGSRIQVIHLAAAHNSTWPAVYVNNSNHNYFSGKLIVGNNTTNCSAPGGTLPGITGSCGVNGPSNFSLSSGVSVANSFVAKLSASDSVNNSGQAGNGTTPFGALTDWTRFENGMRFYGIDGGNFPMTSNRGRCSSGSCRIWDFSLRADDGVLRETLSIPTGNDYAVHLWSVSGVAECNAIKGAVWQDQACSRPGYYSAAACSAPAVWSTNLCSTKFLRNAVEVFGDGSGNENGLCESNEVCLFTPNIGAYQGHGNAISAGTFINGELTNITLIRFQDNGR